MSQQEPASPATSDATAKPEALPEIPRPITPKVARRAWMEPQVRFWWLVAGVLAFITVYLGVSHLSEWMEENRAIWSGVVVQAVGYLTVDERDIVGRPLPVTVPIRIQYEHNGRVYKLTGMLSPTTDAYVSGKPFPVHIDPANPTNWTSRISPIRLQEKMIGVSLPLLASAAAFFVAALLRWRILRVWTMGEVVIARIASRESTAIAPRSTVLRCSTRNGRNQTMVRVYVPQTMDTADAKQIELLIVDDTSTALAVRCFS